MPARLRRLKPIVRTATRVQQAAAAGRQLVARPWNTTTFGHGSGVAHCHSLRRLHCTPRDEEREPATPIHKSDADCFPWFANGRGCSRRTGGSPLAGDAPSPMRRPPWARHTPAGLRSRISFHGTGCLGQVQSRGRFRRRHQGTVDMLEQLDQVDWRHLTRAYGSAKDVPKLFTTALQIRQRNGIRKRSVRAGNSIKRIRGASVRRPLSPFRSPSSRWPCRSCCSGPSRTPSA